MSLFILQTKSMPKLVDRRFKLTKKRTERYIEFALIIACGGLVVLSTMKGSTDALESNLEPYRAQLFALNVQAGELEIKAAELNRVDEIVPDGKGAVAGASNIQKTKVSKFAEATAYTCDKNMTPTQKRFNCPNGVTADGSIPKAGVTVACGPNMLGKVIEIVGLGERVCQDRGSMITDNHIDVFVDTHHEAMKFGRKNVEYSVR